MDELQLSKPLIGPFMNGWLAIVCVFHLFTVFFMVMVAKSPLEVPLILQPRFFLIITVRIKVLKVL